MFVMVEQFISDIVDEYGHHPISTEMEVHSILIKPVNF
jgi:hypothetical protein